MNTTKKIRLRLENWGRGHIFFHSDFADMGEDEAVRKYITRLCKKGDIIRYGRGIFYFPVIEKEYGLGIIPASNTMIAKAYAEKEGIKLYMTQDASKNILGLSTQNQINTIYQTDGRTKHINTGIGNGIRLIHTSNTKLSAFKSDTMRLLSIALQGTQKEDYNKEQIDILKKHISEISERDYNHDIKLINTKTRQLINQCR